MKILKMNFIFTEKKIMIIKKKHNGKISFFKSIKFSIEKISILLEKISIGLQKIFDSFKKKISKWNNL
jgi:hypothetical protein